MNLYSEQHLTTNSTPIKKRGGGGGGNGGNIDYDTPPPLPQRNLPKKSLPTDTFELTDSFVRRVDTQISDLDHSTDSPSKGSSNLSSKCNKKRSKNKTKALSDPKLSSQLLIDMESSLPPPLPPRQQGMIDEPLINFINNNNSKRSMPNSVDSMMNYPVIATCTAVRDNISAAFPLSRRPNIVQQLQQQEHNFLQQQHHLSSVNKSSVSKFKCKKQKKRKSFFFHFLLKQFLAVFF